MAERVPRCHLDGLANPALVIDAEKRIVWMNEALRRVVSSSEPGQTLATLGLFAAASLHMVYGAIEEVARTSVVVTCDVELSSPIRPDWSAVRLFLGELEPGSGAGHMLVILCPGQTNEVSDWDVRLVDFVNPAVILGADHRIRFIASGSARALGYGREELIGVDWCLQMTPKEDRQWVCSHLDAAVQGRAGGSVLLPAQARDGARLLLLWTVIAGSEFAEPGVLLLGRGQDEQSRARNTWFRDAGDALLGKMLPGIAHDLNNMLTGILGYCEFLSEADLGPEARSDADLIRHEGERAAALIRDALLSSGQSFRGPRSISLNDEIERVLRLHRYRLTQQRTKVETELAANLPDIWIDPQELVLALLNVFAYLMRVWSPVNRLTISVRTSAGPSGVRVEFSAPPREGAAEPAAARRETSSAGESHLSLTRDVVSRYQGRLIEEQADDGTEHIIVELPLDDRNST